MRKSGFSIKKIQSNNFPKAKAHSILPTLMRNIHSQIPPQQFNKKKIATSLDIRTENFRGKNYNRVVIYLLSNGCEWALKEGNGCLMCGHLAKQTRDTNLISANDLINQFDSVFETLNFKKYPIVNLYNNGSF